VLRRTGSANASNYYNVEARATNAGNSSEDRWSDIASSGGWVQTNGDWDLVLTGLATGEYDQFAPIASASQFSFSGASTFCSSNFSGGTWTSDFARALCNVFAFLWVPSQQSVNNMATLPGLAQTKVPFSYVTEIVTTVTSLNPASSSFPSISYQFHYPGTATQSLDVFSYNTLTTYITPTQIGIFRALAAAVIYISTGLALYHKSKSLFG